MREQFVRKLREADQLSVKNILRAEVTPVFVCLRHSHEIRCLIDN